MAEATITTPAAITTTTTYVHTSLQLYLTITAIRIKHNRITSQDYRAVTYQFVINRCLLLLIVIVIYMLVIIA